MTRFTVIHPSPKLFAGAVERGGRQLVETGDGTLLRCALSDRADEIMGPTMRAWWNAVSTVRALRKDLSR